MRFIKRVLHNLAIMLAMLPVGLALAAGVIWLFGGNPEDSLNVRALAVTLFVFLISAMVRAAQQEAADRINKK